MPRLRNQGGYLYRGSLLHHELREVRQYHEAERKQQVPSRDPAAVGSHQITGGALSTSGAGSSTGAPYRRPVDPALALRAKGPIIFPRSAGESNFTMVEMQGDP